MCISNLAIMSLDITIKITITITITVHFEGSKRVDHILDILLVFVSEGHIERPPPLQSKLGVFTELLKPSKRRIELKWS